MTRHRAITLRELLMWALAFTLLMVLLAALDPPGPIKPLDTEEREQLVQECIDIFTMDNNANIAACLELRHTPPESE